MSRGTTGQMAYSGETHLSSGKNQQKFVRKPIFPRLIIGKYYNAADSSFGNVYNLTGSEKKNEHFKENITYSDTALQ